MEFATRGGSCCRRVACAMARLDAAVGECCGSSHGFVDWAQSTQRPPLKSTTVAQLLQPSSLAMDGRCVNLDLFSSTYMKSGTTWNAQGLSVFVLLI